MYDRLFSQFKVEWKHFLFWHILGDFRDFSGREKMVVSVVMETGTAAL
jgi:hypothetical protein